MQHEETLEVQRADAVARLVCERRERETQEVWGCADGEVVEVVARGQNVNFQRPNWCVRQEEGE